LGTWNKQSSENLIPMSFHLKKPANLIFQGALFMFACLKFLTRAALGPLVLLSLLAPAFAHASSNLLVRVMAANLNGNSQTIEPSEIRIFQGLKPDVVAIQEFNYEGNSAAEIRSFVNTAFGTNFEYYRESGYQIPNGIISRYPILSSGSWTDAQVSNRAFAWARIDLPGSNDLYVVSVHLLTSSSSVRNQEAAALKTFIQTQFPAGSWVVLAGDMNTDSRAESAISTFKTFLSDSPVPTDSVSGGKPGTNNNREKPYDYVLPSFSLAAYQTNTVMPSVTFPNGLVFDSRVYKPISDVSPVQAADSGYGQHMAVIKDFLVPVEIPAIAGAPLITSQPVSVSVLAGQTASFSVSVSGEPPMTYQWYHTGAVIADATASSFVRTNVQSPDLGVYQVVITNSFGAVTSAPVYLAFIAAPTITNQPSSLSVEAGNPASFRVAASGNEPLAYQWYFKGSAITGATASSFTRPQASEDFAGSYFAVVSNPAGHATSEVATLTILATQPAQRAVITRWSFNNTNTTLTSPPPDTGAGVASLIGGTTATFAGGSTTDTNGTNQGWNTATYPAPSTGNKSAGAQFNVSTAGRRNIEVRWDNKASSTGTRYARFLYSTNGTTFVEWPFAFTNSTTFEAHTNRLSGLPNVDNNPNFAFRVVAEFEVTATGQGTVMNYAGASGSYGTGGTLRFDMVTVSGELIPPVGTNAVLTSSLLSNGDVRLNVAGSPGAAYTLEMTSTLSAPGWAPLATNTSPFNFTHTNQGIPAFFRARYQ
jgi:endonuclease/exonuclease/phosphatase family metal-dependent hydrolase